MSGNVPPKCRDYIYKGDREKLKKQISLAVQNGDKYLRTIVRTVTANGSVKNVKVTANIIVDDDGSKHLEGTIIDITDQVKLADELRKGRKKIEQSRNEIAAAIEHSGIDMWQYNPQKGSINYYVPSFFLHNVPVYLENYPQAFIDMNIIDKVSIDDFLQLHTDIKNGVPLSENAIKISEECGGGWFRVVLSNKLDVNGNSEVVYCTAENIDIFKNNEEQFDIASKEQKFYIWSVDLLKREMLFSDEIVNIYGGENVMQWKGVDDYTVQNVHPADKMHYSELYRTAIEEKTTAKGRIRKKNNLTGKWDHLNMVLIPVFDKNGSLIKIIGSAKVINNLVESEENYNLIKHHFTLSDQKGFMAMFKLNLTKNICTGGQTSEERYKILQKSGTFDGFVKKSLEYIPYESDRLKCREVFSRNKLLEMYGHGQRNVSLEYRFKIKHATASWVRSNLDMAENPETGDIEAVIYSREINEEKMNALVMEKLIYADYDLVTTFPVSTEELKVFVKFDDADSKTSDNAKYSDAIKTTILNNLNEKDVDEALRRTELKTLIKELEVNSVYEVSYSTKPVNGVSLRKKWGFMYLDETKTVILATRSDVTNVFDAITAQEQALAEALRRAEAASVAKTEFLSRMSHEMRTPMNAIIGMTSIVGQSIKDAATVKDCVEKVDASAHTLLGMINDVLDMSQLESSVSELKSEKVCFSTIISNVKSEFIPSAEERGVKLEVVSDDMNDRTYYGDGQKIERIIFNLISNAVKFTKENGCVKLSFKKRAITPSKAEVEIIVSDTGVGMNADFIPKIFLPFEQENTGRTSEYSGGGLGLALCKNYIDMMGGTIDVKSAKNVGSVFTVVLKMKTEMSNAAKNEMCSNSLKNDIIDYSGKRVLICEDNPINAAIAVKLISSKNAEVLVAENGKIGVDIFSNKGKGYFDAVIMDIRMPVMDGLEASKEIRAKKELGGAEIPIIAMSANTFDEDIEIAKRSGINDYVTKPVNPMLLFTTLSKYL